MKIATQASLFITVFLSVSDGVVTNHLSQPKSVESNINNTTTQLVNYTMIQLQSNSQYPVQVIMFPIIMNDNMTNETDNANSTQSVFRLLLSPRDYDYTLCTPVSSTMIDVELHQSNKTDDIDSLYPTGLLIKSDTAENCTFSNIVSNVIELNRMLPESESIQYLIVPNDSNVSYIQIDTIANNNMTSELISSNNITIVYLESSYKDAIMTIIQSEELITGCSPFLLESENITTCNFIYQLNVTMNNANSNGQQQSSSSNSFLSLKAVSGYLYLMLAALLILSCIYRRYHPILVTVPELSASFLTIEKEKNPTKLTEKQFESLSETKYTLDLIEKLKKYGNNNNNNVTSNTIVLHNSTSTNIRSSLEQQPTKDEMIVPAKDCVSSDTTNTTRIKDDDDLNKFNCGSCHKNKMSDLEAPLQTIHRLDSSRNSNINSDNAADECDICCPICIEDFIVDEIVIVLPKCNHIYHKHCIKQWLMKKQGCCPYCKVVVIDDDVAIDNDTKNDDNS